MVYKYQTEDELKNLKDIPIDYFRKYIDKQTKSNNKIVWFSNKDSRLYYCTYCRKWHHVNTKEHFKKGEYLTCGNCMNRFEVIHSHNVIKPIEMYLTKLETNKRNELILRSFFYRKIYDKKYGDFSEFFIEVERLNVDKGVAMKANSYRVMGNYNIHHANLHKEFKRDNTGYFREYSYARVVNRNVKQIIRKTKYKYSVLDLAAKKEIDILDYLLLYNEYPKLELLMKSKAFNFAIDLVYRRAMGYSTFAGLRNFDKECMKMVVINNLNYKQTVKYLETKIKDIKLLDLATKMNFKPFKEIDKWMLKDLHYLTEKSYSCTNYHDYLFWCEKLGMDLNDKKVRYPDNPSQAHDETFKQYQMFKDEKHDKQINDYSKLLDKYSYHNSKNMIRPVCSHSELIVESELLHHCVRSYAERMAKRETAIFVIRKMNESDSPFVTLELKDNTVKQCRANRNARPPDDVIEFVNKWCMKYNFESCFR